MPSKAKTEITPVALSASSCDLQGKNLGDITLPEAIFGQKVNKNLLAQYVRVYLANQRQGTHNTKTRSQVKYSTRKIYRQKGTGRARHGSRRAPIFVGGGVAFGPHPVDHSLAFNKKMTTAAIISAYSQQAQNNKIKILTDFDKSLKTANFVSFAKTLESGFNRLLLLSASNETMPRKSVANLRNMTSLDIASANPYEIIKAKQLVITSAALEQLSTNFDKNSSSQTQV